MRSSLIETDIKSMLKLEQYKRYGLCTCTILQVIFITIVLLTNIITGKYITILKIPLTAGIITYPITFLITDIISEVYGKQKASETVWLGLIASIVMIIILMVVKVLPIHQNSPVDTESFNKVFYFTPGIVFSSMIAYLVSQFCDVHIFHFIKNKTGGKHLWFRNNVATIISQFVDTITFAVIAWIVWKVFSAENMLPSFSLWFKIARSEFFVKCIFAFLDTPILYFVLWGIKTIPENKYNF